MRSNENGYVIKDAKMQNLQIPDAMELDQSAIVTEDAVQVQVERLEFVGEVDRDTTKTEDVST